MPALEDLRKAVIEQKQAALPYQVDDEALRPLHEAVVAYDQALSQVVIAAIQGLPASEGSRQALISSRDQAASQLARLSDAESRPVQVYRQYTARLDRMLALVDQVLDERR